MCGIVGIINKNKSRDFSEELYKMLESVAHRGPDSQSVMIDKKLGCYLGFSRLAMVDISGSNQPYRYNNYIAMFNGEIYNFNYLREYLTAHRIDIYSRGEIEIILKLFLYLGNEFVNMLDGMFSIVIINTVTNEVYLARDKFGIKPLYYLVRDDYIAFSSELKALRCWNTFQINKKAIELYVNLRYVPAPMTIYNDVYKMMAGQYVRFIDGNLEKNIYYNYASTLTNPGSDGSYDEKLINAIETTYSSSDVPIGLFLSGGIDSGIIATVIKGNLRKDNQVFCIEYGDKANDSDSNIAKLLSDELDINCCFVSLKERILTYLNRVVYALDEPFYSTVSISTLYLAEQASKKVKGVLTGDGSDELIYGYKYVRDAVKAENVYESYLQGIGWLKYIDPSDLVKEYALDKTELMKNLFEDCRVEGNAEETIRRVEIFKRLPDYHLTRVDRLTMNVGLEARVPYLRSGYVEHILGMSSDNFLKYTDSKMVLKESNRLNLSKILTERIKKPFTAPVNEWIEGELKEDIHKLFSDNDLVERMFLDSEVVKKILAEYKGSYADVSNIWGIYLLLKWGEMERQL